MENEEIDVELEALERKVSNMEGVSSEELDEIENLPIFNNSEKVISGILKQVKKMNIIFEKMGLARNKAIIQKTESGFELLFNCGAFKISQQFIFSDKYEKVKYYLNFILEKDEVEKVLNSLKKLEDGETIEFPI
jgi:aminopeptidase C